MIYETIDNASKLRDKFIAYDRDNFSDDGYEALFEILNEMGDYKLDVIAINCDFNESTEDEIRADYDLDKNLDVEQYLQDNTMATKLSNGDFLYQSF